MFLSQCPDGFFFDESAGWCDVPEVVDCGDRPHPPLPTTTPAPPTTTEPYGNLIKLS